MTSRLLRQLQWLTAHLLVALVALVVIGGATRVMQAGLACPDWPLCYGSLLPGRQMNVQVFLEWFHRLDAFVVGIGVLVLAATAAIQRRQLPRWLPWLSGSCLLLVAFQGALGALTVTLLLPPGIVTAHLATALLLVMLVSVCHQLLEAAASQPESAVLGSIPGLSVQTPGPTEAPRNEGIAQAPAPAWWPWLAGLATLLVAAQSLLGGLMATQWAASLCFSAGSGCAWLAAHRLAATPAALVVLVLAVTTVLAPGWCRQQRPLTITAALLVITQIALGVTSLRLQLSVPGVTIAHQLVAALLLAILAALTCRGWIAVAGLAVSASALSPALSCPLPRPRLSMVSATPMNAGITAAAAPALTRQDVVPSRKKVTLPAWLEIAKPRLIPLLLATTLGGMALSEGWPLPAPRLACTLGGGALAAAAAGVLNCLWEQELDGRMVRTSGRALPSGRLSATTAFLVAIALTTAAATLLVGGVNCLAAGLSLLGLCSYVLLYTVVLKPRTPQNIVIGGVAGAIPPLVGAAAATGHVGLSSWWLFGLVMVWTPAHFWALALLLKDDYRSVGIPMLPVVKGTLVTARAIQAYALVTVLVSSFGLLALPSGGLLYSLLLIPFNARLLQMAWALRRQPDDVTAAKGLFRWSILYLFGLCLLLLLARLPLAASFGSQSAELIQQWIGPLALVTF